MVLPRLPRIATLFILIFGILILGAYLHSPSTANYAPWTETLKNFTPMSEPMFPFAIDADVKDYHTYNAREIDSLKGCMDGGDCRRNQRKVVLACTHVWPKAIIDGWRGGEGVWALSMFRAMRELGYTVILGMDDWKETLTYYRMFPDQVKVIIQSDWVNDCMRDPLCIKSESNPTGIARWKSEFHFNFFPDPMPGLDAHLSVEADRYELEEEEDYRRLQYIGYSIEEDCEKQDLIPHAERPMTAWILAKQAAYFHVGPHLYAFNDTYYTSTLKEEGLDGLSFRAAYEITDNYMKNDVIEPIVEVIGVTNLGIIGPDRFRNEVASSRIMIGIGNPPLSPSPYLSLCLATPFLNPIRTWDSEHPNDRSKWVSQHNYLKWLDPPYVYNVRAHDYQGFVDAIHEALNNPPPRYIDPSMTPDSIRKRVKKLVDNDWRSIAKTYLEEREAEGEIIADIPQEMDLMSRGAESKIPDTSCIMYRLPMDIFHK
ncbi:uncharacterized protein IL334_003398 [Kwoniella shivajii]|uniref:Alpha-1,6-mannosyl-glycoprotein 6-beta-N-acetylglucosaminyltransferase n=1 Tax=Kwoniella shivajii TaxID=564305 RepID=A0ABZ1D0F4_9TREE|nr:hypothetical protein IL334_003398 [Kwoniella shivajii]